MRKEKSLRRSLLLAAIGGVALILSSCGGDSGGGPVVIAPTPTPSPTPTPTPPPRDITGVTSETVANFSAPWAMEFLPDGRFLLSERDGDVQAAGKLWVVTQAGSAASVTGAPTNTGLLDIKLDPGFATNRLIYVTYLEPGGPSEPRVGRNAADMSRVPEGVSIFRARLPEGTGTLALTNVEIIWRQRPKIVHNPGSGEPGGHMAFSPDRRYLFVALGDRQEFAPVQDFGTTLGKVIRIFPDGTVPTDNPFVSRAGALPEIWTLGHRNPYGLAFDAAGQLWAHEHGPEGGDEFNLIEPGSNYGWPNVSNGRNYGSATDDIPDHKPGDGYAAPAISWSSAIAPAGLIFYSGDQFAAWRGQAVLGGLRGQLLDRVSVAGKTAKIEQTIAMAKRIRDVEQGPDGSIWAIQDGPAGAIMKLTPVFAP